MKKIKFGKREIEKDGKPFFIAEIGHNHQGNLDTALKMVETAAFCGADAVKLQKRHNKVLYTEAFYNSPYNSENSYAPTYGKHRDFLEFDLEQYKKLKEHAAKHNIEFFSTAFDIPSVDFLEELGVEAYKIASGDITNIPLLHYVAKKEKPMFVSTGAADLDEVKQAYNAILKYNNQIVLMHCAAGYPTDYENLNLAIIQTFNKEFPETIIGYSGHDDGIMASLLAHMLGATVFEKHFTLNHSWKGTDQSFSLMPEGLRKQIRDLQRVKVALGDDKKIIREFEKEARYKMGKSIYTAKALKKGTKITEKNIVLKSPAEGLVPYHLEKVIGKKLKVNLRKEVPVRLKDLE